MGPGQDSTVDCGSPFCSTGNCGSAPRHLSKRKTNSQTLLRLHAPMCLDRPVHEQLSCVVRQAAEDAVGTESLLVVLAALQVRDRQGFKLVLSCWQLWQCRAQTPGCCIQPIKQHPVPQWQRCLCVLTTACSLTCALLPCLPLLVVVVVVQLLVVEQEAVEEAAAAAAAAQQPTDGSNHCHTGPAAAAAGPHQPTAGAQAMPAAAAAAAQGASTSSAATPATVTECPNDILQVVLWMHHIKSTEKRKNVVGWARELGCSGFSKPGFPGVVVVEGAAPDVREYVARVRALQWQAIQVRAERLTHCTGCNSGGGTAASSRAFSGRFTELLETGLSQLSQECKAAGLEDLFCAALKLERKG